MANRGDAPAAPDVRVPPLLEGQRALVTGASSGIGRAVALSFAAAGADVVVNYRSKVEQAEEVVRAIEGLGRRAFAHAADVSVESEVIEMFDAARSAFGTLDIVVNNAGLQKDGPFAEMSLEDWQKVIDVNLTGQFLCAREAVREFLRREPREGVSVARGKIICMSSVHEEIPWSRRVNYAASKGGISMMMQSLAQEVAQHGIRVNGIAPGAIKTAINEEAWQDESSRRQLRSLIPYGRIGEPADIGRAAVWLASDQADYVTGATLRVDGGMALYPSFEERAE